MNIHKAASSTQQVSDSLSGLLKDRFKSARRFIDRRMLEIDLERYINAANAHESNGVTAGNHLYGVLYRQADERCRLFTTKWSLDTAFLYAEIPGLERLRRLAEPAAAIGHASKFTMITCLVLVAAFFAGILAGAANVAFHLIGGR
ncbi:MAG: hypothetical protein JWO13_2736 [Acidobacteriales bacterium]|nr:hypothetical protein [Terriglobales bacterium]